MSLLINLLGQTLIRVFPLIHSCCLLLLFISVDWPFIAAATTTTVIVQSCVGHLIIPMPLSAPESAEEVFQSQLFNMMARREYAVNQYDERVQQLAGRDEGRRLQVQTLLDIKEIVHMALTYLTSTADNAIIKIMQPLPCYTLVPAHRVRYPAGSAPSSYSTILNHLAAPKVVGMFAFVPTVGRHHHCIVYAGERVYGGGLYHSTPTCICLVNFLKTNEIPITYCISHDMRRCLYCSPERSHHHDSHDANNQSSGSGGASSSHKRPRSPSSTTGAFSDMTDE